MNLAHHHSRQSIIFFFFLKLHSCMYYILINTVKCMVIMCVKCVHVRRIACVRYAQTVLPLALNNIIVWMFHYMGHKTLWRCHQPIAMIFFIAFTYNGNGYDTARMYIVYNIYICLCIWYGIVFHLLFFSMRVVG